MSKAIMSNSITRDRIHELFDVTISRTADEVDDIIDAMRTNQNRILAHAEKLAEALEFYGELENDPAKLGDLIFRKTFGQRSFEALAEFRKEFPK